MPNEPKMVFQFQSGCSVPENNSRPNRCDTCKKPTTNVKQASNTLGIRHFMCPDCMERYVEYMRDFYWKSLSVVDGASDGVLAVLHMHDDDPKYVRKKKAAIRGTSTRQVIKKRLQDLEMEKVMNMSVT